ncbi:cupin-like domain-containing protein [Rhodanobacter aciditrophus]|uniref:cupin-like domain-containing protein n=1 Tax=Rhodanobacter aciditrophus TaxID=1623218 RepID=UPI003CF83B76
MSHQEAVVQIDWGAFDPWKIMPVRHRLMQHPLLQMDALVELGRRLDARGSVRTHSDDAVAGTPFNTAPRMHPNRAGAAATLAGIAEAKAWMSLLNVQADPLYRTLVDEVLDGVAPGVARRDPGMGYRGGWIFVTSPRAVTPFHFDKEHNFILQVHGRKTLYVWDPRDTAAASERARDLFHATHSRDRLQWDESLRARAHVFHLEPGDGAYMPSTSPHMVENGDGPSVTVSCTYYTDATRRDALLHRTHERLRTWGMEPPPVGHSRWLDAGLLAAFRAAALLRRCRARIAGVPLPQLDREPYALARSS